MQDPQQNTELGNPHFFLAKKKVNIYNKKKGKRVGGYATTGIIPIACYCQEEYMVLHIHYR
jgi:hypothetical protein